LPALPAMAVPALADGGSSSPGVYGPPPEPPVGSAEDAEDAPRRDIHMGTVDHMRTGRDEDGNVIMEVRPRPKKTEEQPQAGPFYIYPQIGVPGPMPMGGQPGQGMPAGGGQGQRQQGMPAGVQQGQAGRMGQAGQTGQGQTGQGWPAGAGQGQTGRMGQSGPSMPGGGSQNQPGQSGQIQPNTTP